MNNARFMTELHNNALQLASRYSRTLEQLVEVFEQVRYVLPRFESYASRFPLKQHKQLETTLAEYHIELINICDTVIKFYKKHPLRKPALIFVSKFTSASYAV